MRTSQEVAEILRDAFRPLQCRTEVHYDREFGFRVYAGDGREVYTQPLMVATSLLDDAELTRFVRRARTEVERRSGIKLDTWRLPT